MSALGRWRGLVVAAGLMGLTAVPRLALAQPEAASEVVDAEWEALLAEAKEAFEQGRYAVAAERLQQAYTRQPKAYLLYNLGRALQEAGELEAALEAFLRYQRTDPSAARKQKAYERIAELETKLRERRMRRSLRKLRGQAGAVRRERRSAPELELTAPPPRFDAGPGQATWGWIVGGGGAALTVAGVVTTVLGYVDKAAVDEATIDAAGVTQLSRREALELRDSARLKSGLGFGLTIAGVATVATGLVLLATAPEEEAVKRTSVRVVVAPGGIAIGGGF